MAPSTRINMEGPYIQPVKVEPGGTMLYAGPYGTELGDKPCVLSVAEIPLLGALGAKRTWPYLDIGCGPQDIAFNNVVG